MIYDWVNNELRINTSTLGEMGLYVDRFGGRLFGDESKFVYSEKYTLRPLKEQGHAALFCRDIAGIERVRLLELECYRPQALHLIEHYRSEDVFESLALLNRQLGQDAELRKAVFGVKLEGEKKARSVAIRPPSSASYGRSEEAMIIEEWLRARGFILVGAATDEKADRLMASA